jgi:hypothetical protein
MSVRRITAALIACGVTARAGLGPRRAGSELGDGEPLLVRGSFSASARSG